MNFFLDIDMEDICLTIGVYLFDLKILCVTMKMFMFVLRVIVIFHIR